MHAERRLSQPQPQPPVAVALALAMALLFLAGPSAAKGKADREGERAMNELFSAAQFDEAKTALAAAISDCGSCSKHTLAVLHVDLGIVFITGLRDKKSGASEMRKARAIDPGVTLDPAFVTPEVQAAFDAAGGGGGGGGGATLPVSPLEKEVVLEDEPDDHPKKSHKKHAAPTCTTNDDCDADQVCKDDECVTREVEPPPPPPPPPREHSVWLAFGIIQDFAFVSGSDVCTKASQVNSGNTCLRASGSQYHGTPLGGANLGFTPSLGTTRITLASYFPVSSAVSLGLRMGYAFAGKGPTPDGGKPFLPVHAEVQGAYWLSSHAFSTEHVGTFLEASGGFGQMVGHGSVHVDENLTLLPDGSRAFPPPANQIDNPPSQTLTAYQTSGSGFAGVGAGAFLPFGGGSALLADLRLSAFFPTSGVALSLGVGGAFGL